MSAYRAILSARIRVLLQYRAAALAGFGTQLFWGFIKVMIFEAFYLSAAVSVPMTLPEVISYIWLGQAMLAVLPWNVDRELAQQMRTGEVAYALLKPIDLYGQWYCRAFAMRSAPTVMRAGPMFLFAGLVLPLVGASAWALQPPPGVAQGVLWGFAMISAVFLSAAMTMLWHISMMWTVSAKGATHLAPALVVIFSGMVVPLPLFPESVQTLLSWLPFAGLFDLPARIFIGHIPPSAETVHIILRQLAWTAALVVLGRAMLRRGLRRLIIQGG